MATYLKMFGNLRDKIGLKEFKQVGGYTAHGTTDRKWRNKEKDTETLTDMGKKDTVNKDKFDSCATPIGFF